MGRVRNTGARGPRFLLQFILGLLGVLAPWLPLSAGEDADHAPSLLLLEYLGALVETEEGLIGPEDMGLDDVQAQVVAPDQGPGEEGRKRDDEHE
jgi:hypothetical protein